MRKLALALACASILGTSNVQAMGLGEVVVRSYLNQPLLAEIPLVDVSPQDVDSLRVRLASAQSFERQGLSLSAVAGRIQVQVQGGKRPVILLTSKTPIREPMLGVVLEVEGPDGTLQRVYDILLDPVSYRTPVPSVAAARAPEPERRVEAPVPPIVPGVALQGQVENGHYRVREGETLWRVAYNLRPPGVSTEQMMAALRAANPGAFSGSGRSQRLLSGALLRIPETDEILRARVKKPDAAVTQKVAAEAAAPVARTAEPKLAIVAPAPVAPTPSAPAAAAPVVGEVVSPPAAGSLTSATEALRLQEQLEAVKVEKEQLLQRLGTLEGQMAKMEELLRLKDEQIRQLESLAQGGGAAKPVAETPSSPPAAEARPAEPPVAAQPPSPPPPEAAQPQPPAKEAVKPQPTAVPEEQEGGLLSLLTQPIVLGGAGVVGLLLALLIGRLRRRREEAQVLDQAPSSPAVAPAPEPASAPITPAAGLVAAGAAVAALGSAEAEPAPAVDAASGTGVDPVQSVLEEVDVMQTYGLHDRAREVLEEAIARMPEADVLQARRVRLFHEMGARDEFLRAAEAYRATHPAADDPHWATIQAIGTAAYPDAPLFAAPGAPAAETAPVATPISTMPTAVAAPELPALDLPELASRSALEPALDLAELGLQSRPVSPVDTAAGPAANPLDVPLELTLPPLDLAVDEKSTPAQDAAVTAPVKQEAGSEALSLDLPPLELHLDEPLLQPRERVETPAPGTESLSAFDLQTLELGSVAGASEPSSVVATPAVEEPLILPEPLIAGQAVEAVPVAEQKASPSLGGEVSEDDLMLLGLDEASLDAAALELPELVGLDLEEPELPLPTLMEESVAEDMVQVASSSPTPASAVMEAPPLKPAQGTEGLGAAQILPSLDPSLTRLDERAIKLDMAQALIELGEREEARGVLEEIIAGGQDEHAARARGLLDQVAS